jgi:hypothetical protein
MMGRMGRGRVGVVSRMRKGERRREELFSEEKGQENMTIL